MGLAQTELFPSPQADLFGEPSAPEPARHVPKREHILSPLNEILTAMRAADRWPWDEVQTELKRNRVVPHLLGHLSTEEAARWREDIEAEARRLDAA